MGLPSLHLKTLSFKQKIITLKLVFWSASIKNGNFVQSQQVGLLRVIYIDVQRGVSHAADPQIFGRMQENEARAKGSMPVILIHDAGL